MTAGELTDRISILKPSPTQDGQGGRIIAWVDLVTESLTVFTRLWANVASVSGRESLAAAAISAEVTYIVVMRYRTDVDETMRVQWRPYKATENKTLEIHGVTPYEGGRVFSVLWCSEA